MAGYEPKRPRPAVASDLESLIGPDDGPSERPSPSVVDPTSPSGEDLGAETPESELPRRTLDPTPPAARHALPRAAEPLDRRLAPVALAGVVVGAAVTLYLWRRWGRLEAE
jgi:hypothetical protein